MFKKGKDEDKPKKKTSVSIVPLKDWLIVQNDIRINLKKGEEIEVPKRFIETLKTEKVI